MQQKLKTYEESISELENIISEMEKGNMTLDKSLEYCQRGVELSGFCKKKLDETERKISKLVEKENGLIDEEEIEIKGIVEE